MKKLSVLLITALLLASCTQVIFYPTNRRVVIDGTPQLVRMWGGAELMTFTPAGEPPVVPTLTPTATITQSAGNVFYVDTSGDDFADGLSPDTAWRTFANVRADTTIRLARGSVWNETLYMPGGVTVTDYGSGDAPTISSSNNCVEMTGNGNVLENVLLDGCEKNGVLVGVSQRRSNNNEIRNVEITRAGVGLRVYGQNNAIANNYIHDLSMYVNTPGGDDDQGAVAVWLFDGYNEVFNNRMINCNAPSYDYGIDGGTVEFWASSGKQVVNNYIHDNYAENNKGFSEFGGNGGIATENRIENNIIVNNIGNVISGHMPGTAFGVDFSGLEFVHNTLYLDTTETVSLFYFSQPPDANTLLWRDNIVWLGQSVEKFTYRKDSGFSHDHNVYWKVSSATLWNIVFDASEFVADPMFADDFSLLAGSPAIGAASDGGDLGAR